MNFHFKALEVYLTIFAIQVLTAKRHIINSTSSSYITVQLGQTLWAISINFHLYIRHTWQNTAPGLAPIQTQIHPSTTKSFSFALKPNAACKHWAILFERHTTCMEDKKLRLQFKQHWESKISNYMYYKTTTWWDLRHIASHVLCPGLRLKLAFLLFLDTMGMLATEDLTKYITTRHKFVNTWWHCTHFSCCDN